LKEQASAFSPKHCSPRSSLRMMIKKITTHMNRYTISVFTENFIGILSRITLIFTRRGINIDGFTASESREEGIYRITIEVTTTEEQVIQLARQIEKIIDVIKAFYYLDDEVVFQELALYKIPVSSLDPGLEKVIRQYNARIISAEKDFVVIEMTGHKEDTQELLEILKGFDILEFVRSGRVAVAKPMATLDKYLEKLKLANLETMKLKFGTVEENVVTREEFPLEKANETLKDEVIAVLGYGVQGPGQALNLKDNGFNVIVGQRKNSKTWDKAVADGWVPGETLFEIEEACEKGTILQFLLSDAGQIALWPTVKQYLTPGKALYFSHGFGITYKEKTGIIPPADVDVILVAPKGSGTSLRRMFVEGRGLNSSFAIYQ